jgi:hypothetical protein
MVTNKEIKDKLRKKLGDISESALYKIAKKEYSALYQTAVDEAVYVLALDRGVGIKRHLNSEVVERVRQLHHQYSSNKTSTGVTEARIIPRAGAKKSVQPAVTRMQSGQEYHDPFVADRIKKEARDMAQIYPLLYYLENSIRSFLVAAMEKYHGDDWWDRKVDKKKLRDKVDGYRTKESKNEWHQRRGDREIDYLDFAELKLVYNKVKTELVRDGVLPDERWLENLIDEVYPSRCVVAHMNPLNVDNIRAVKLRVNHWNKQIKNKFNALKP